MLLQCKLKLFSSILLVIGNQLSCIDSKTESNDSFQFSAFNGMNSLYSFNKIII